MLPACVAALTALSFAFAPARPARTPFLKLTHGAVSQSEDGPPIVGMEFRAGDQVFFSFEVVNYAAGPTGRVQLLGHVQVFDPMGVPVIPRDEEIVGTTLSEEDKEWKPKMRVQIQLPSIAPPGNYIIRFDVTDQQSHQMAEEELAFPVEGRGVTPDKSLVIRNLGFYRTQDEETPLKVVAYRAGDMLWVRFDITGYQHGEQNAIDVAYDVSVVTPAGKQLFSQEDAAVEKSQAFYPQPWVPGSFNLSLQSSMTPGTYSLVLTARDGISHQTVESKADFRVE